MAREASIVMDNVSYTVKAFVDSLWYIYISLFSSMRFDDLWSRLSVPHSPSFHGASLGVGDLL